MSTNAPAWAVTLLSTMLARQGNDARALRRGITAFEDMRTMFDTDEQQAAKAYLIDGLKKRLVELEPPAEAERGP